MTKRGPSRCPFPGLTPGSGPPTDDFHHCVAALLRDGDRVLLVHRGPACSWAPDTWDLPGGHVNDGEIEPEAMVREAREELGIAVRPGDLSPIARLRGPDFEVAFFHVTSWAGTPHNAAPEEHTTLAWVRASELCHRRLADPQILPIIQRVLRDRRRSRRTIKR